MKSMRRLLIAMGILVVATAAFVYVTSMNSKLPTELILPPQIAQTMASPTSAIQLTPTPSKAPTFTPPPITVTPEIPIRDYPEYVNTDWRDYLQNIIPIEILADGSFFAYLQRLDLSNFDPLTVEEIYPILNTNNQTIVYDPETAPNGDLKTAPFRRICTGIVIGDDGTEYLLIFTQYWIKGQSDPTKFPIVAGFLSLTSTDPNYKYGQTYPLAEKKMIMKSLMEYMKIPMYDRPSILYGIGYHNNVPQPFPDLLPTLEEVDRFLAGDLTAFHGKLVPIGERFPWGGLDDSSPGLQ